MKDRKLEKQTCLDINMEMLMEKQQRTMKSMSQLFLAIYIVDIRKQLFCPVYSLEGEKNPNGTCVDLNKAIDLILNEITDVEYRQNMKEFLEIATLKKRLEKTNILSCPYCNKYGQWRRAMIVLQNVDENGELSEVLFLIREIDEERRREMTHLSRVLELEEENRKDLGERLSAVLSGIAGGFKICDQDEVFSIRFVSKEVANIQGYSVSEFLKCCDGSFWNNCYPEDLEYVRQQIFEQYERGDTYSVKYRVIHKDGSLKWIQDSGKKVFLSDGSIKHYSLSRDITDEVLMHEKLLAEKTQFREALVKRSAYHCTFDVSDGLLRKELLAEDYSRLLEEKGCTFPIGYDEASRIYIEGEEIVFFDKFSELCFSTRGLLRLYVENLVDRDFEYYQKKSDSYMRVQPFFVIDAVNGHLICSLIVTDITRERKAEKEKKKAIEERLQIQEKLLKEELVAHQQDAILQILSKEYTSVYYVDLFENKAIAFRLSDEIHTMIHVDEGQEFPFYEVYEQYIRNTVVEEEIEEMMVYSDPVVLDRTLKNNELFTHLYRIMRNGQEKYAQIRIARVHQEEKLRYVVMGFAIVDKQVRAKQEEENFLKTALAQAERANLAKTAFLSNMSHDIRTPLNAIIGYTSLATSHVEERQKVIKYLEKIQAASNHLLELINDVLDMSRIESGKVEIDENEIYLKEVTEDIQNIVQMQLQTKKLQMSYELENITCERVMGDRLRLKQILLNCIGNSIKFTPEGGKIRVKVKQVAESVDGFASYLFTIKDTGIGMSQEFLTRIFEPFERESTTTASGIEGTGLGMSITKNLVDMMGGTIQVLSEKGKGTEIRISLQFKVIEVQDKKAEEEKKLSKKERKVREHLHVLLVEDHELNREIATEVLLENGVEVDCAVNGLEAVEKMAAASKGQYDLILMDVQMPVMNGYEATRKIRMLEDSEKADIPIIAMTANAFEEDKKAAYDAGMNAHVAKPIHFTNLLKLVDQIVE